MFVAASLWGCAGTENSEEVTAVSLDKSGKITQTIVEILDKDYYDIDELKTMMDTHIAQYNAQTGEDKVILQSAEMDSKKAVVKITYADAESYEGLNDMILFTGTVEEAKAAGYTINAHQLKCVEEKTDVESLLTDSELRLIILEEPVQVRTFGNIRAMSSQMTLVNKKEAAVDQATEEQLYMILFK